jgi:hypothetical protein
MSINAELNTICHLITLCGGTRYLGFSRLRVKGKIALFKGERLELWFLPSNIFIKCEISLAADQHTLPYNSFC